MSRKLEASEEPASAVKPGPNRLRRFFGLSTSKKQSHTSRTAQSEKLEAPHVLVRKQTSAPQLPPNRIFTDNDPLNDLSNQVCVNLWKERSFLDDVLAAAPHRFSDEAHVPSQSSQVSTPALSDSATISDETPQSHYSRRHSIEHSDDEDDEKLYGTAEPAAFAQARSSTATATSSPREPASSTPSREEVVPALLPLGFRGTSILQKTAKQLRPADGCRSRPLSFLLLKHHVALKLQQGVTKAHLLELERSTTNVHGGAKVATQDLPVLDQVLDPLLSLTPDARSSRTDSPAARLTFRAQQCLMRPSFGSATNVVHEDETTRIPIGRHRAWQEPSPRLKGLAAMTIPTPQSSSSLLPDFNSMQRPRREPCPKHLQVRRSGPKLRTDEAKLLVLPHSDERFTDAIPAVGLRQTRSSTSLASRHCASTGQLLTVPSPKRSPRRLATAEPRLAQSHQLSATDLYASAVALGADDSVPLSTLRARKDALQKLDGQRVRQSVSCNSLQLQLGQESASHRHHGSVRVIPGTTRVDQGWTQPVSQHLDPVNAPVPHPATGQTSPRHAFNGHALPRSATMPQLQPTYTTWYPVPSFSPPWIMQAVPTPPTFVPLFQSSNVLPTLTKRTSYYQTQELSTIKQSPSVGNLQPNRRHQTALLEATVPHKLVKRSSRRATLILQ
ncbi:hypothetical protein ACM66B_005490 [Microbotryomycetes sp. NB124-2]